MHVEKRSLSVSLKLVKLFSFSIKKRAIRDGFTINSHVLLCLVSSCTEANSFCFQFLLVRQMQRTVNTAVSSHNNMLVPEDEIVVERTAYKQEELLTRENEALKVDRLNSKTERACNHVPISNSNWTEWSTIRGVIGRVISKSDEREARGRFRGGWKPFP